MVTDPERARATARAYAAGCLRLPNYLNSLREPGFTDADFDDRGVDSRPPAEPVRPPRRRYGAG